MNDSQNKLVQHMQERWDKKYPGLELQFKKHKIDENDKESGYDAYLLNWKLVGKRGITKGSVHSIDREQVEGRYVSIDILHYTLDMMEKEFEHWAIQTILADYRGDIF